MKVIITGATSMVGSAIVRNCIDNGCEVLAIVRKNTSRLTRLPESKLLKVIYYNLDELDQIKLDEKYDVFYHIAWGPNVKEFRDDCYAQKDNIKATLDAIKLASNSGCKKFIGAGSQAEYGPHNELIDTNTVCHPFNAYGMSKLAASMLGAKLCNQLNMNFIWGRIFSIYGINDNKGTMLDYAVNCYKNNEVAKFSSGNQYWNYLFEEDVGKMFYLLGEKHVESGIYNIASNESKPLKEYIREFADVFGTNFKYQLAEKDDSNVYGLNVDISKTKNAISYVPETSFKEGIKKIFDVIGGGTTLDKVSLLLSSTSRLGGVYNVF